MELTIILVKQGVSLKKYRSKLEARVARRLGKDWEYEPGGFKYLVPRTYYPDFVKGNIYVEVKGYFRAGDTQKYAAINREMKAQGKDFRFVLQSPDKKVRKGSKITMAEWCDKHNIQWSKA